MSRFKAERDVLPRDIAAMVSIQMGSYQLIRMNGRVVVNRILERGEFREVDMWEAKDVNKLRLWLGGG